MTLQNNYNNPLDNFRSYSYHFTMVASSTTEAFRKLIFNNGVNLFSKINTIKLGDEFKIDNQSSYLVLDTRRFSQYSIDSFESENVYGTGSQTNPSVPVSTIKIKLTDSTGLSFFNFMIELMRDKLQTTKASAFFLLSIIFVGHKDDGTSETISTCHIPLNLILMGFEFTHRGSEYEMEFVEIEGAPQRGMSLNQINNLGDIKTVNTKDGGNNTLGEMLDNLEQRLNDQSLRFFKKYTNEFNKTANPNDRPGKLVQYMITIPDYDPVNWKNFKIDTANKSKYKETNFSSESTTTSNTSSSAVKTNGEYSIITFSETTTVTDAIKVILESSSDFLKLASRDNVKSGNGKAFRTLTSVTSDDSTYVIHFDIYPYDIPKEKAEDPKDKGKVIKGGSSNHNIVGTQKIVNVISYDYIFTGLNSHIKDLKIKYDPVSAVALDTDVNIGLSRFSQNASNGNTNEAAKKSAASDEKKSIQFNTMIRPGDPIFIPIKSKDQSSNVSSVNTPDKTTEQSKEIIKSKQEYSQTYASLHFLSSISIDMTVRGNPNIIRKYSDREQRGGIPPHPTLISNRELKQLNSEQVTSNFKGQLDSAKREYINTFVKPRILAKQKDYARGSNAQTDALLNNVDVVSQPIFVKINIKAPNVDWTGEYKQNNPLFTDEFFYNGYYQILTIRTTFSGGDFEHQMTLIPYDVQGEVTGS